MFVYLYLDGSANLSIQAGSISSNTITLGTGVVVAAGGRDVLGVGLVALSSTTFALVYVDNANENWVVIGSVSGTTITLGTPVDTSLAGGRGTQVGLIAMSSSQVVLYWIDQSTFELTAVVGTVVSTAVTLATPVALSSPVTSASSPAPYGVKVDSTHFCISHPVYANPSAPSAVYGVAASIAATVITFGSAEVVIPGWWSGFPLIGAFVVALSSSEVAFIAGSTQPTVASLSGVTLTPTIGETLPIPLALSAAGSPLFGAPYGSTPNWLPMVVVGSVLLWVDGLFNLYEGDASGDVSPSIAHPGILFYALLPISSTKAMALLVDGAMNILAHVVNCPAFNTSVAIGCTASAVSSSATATVVTSGQSCSGFSGLMPGAAYYHNGDGTLVTANTGHPAGTALTSSALLVA